MVFSAAYLRLYARYSMFAYAHCSADSSGNKALSLARNNVPPSQFTHETTGCSHLLELLSLITCVMYASISTANPFLTQTNDCRWNREFFSEGVWNWLQRDSICSASEHEIEHRNPALSICIGYRFHQSPDWVRLANETRIVPQRADDS